MFRVHILSSLAIGLVLASAACERDPINPPSSTEQMGTDDGAEHGNATRGSSTSETPRGTSMPDHRLANRIQMRLMADDSVDFRSVEVRVENGEVWLEGRLETAEDNARVEAIVSQTAGVSAVHNLIDAPPPPVEPVTDEGTGARALVDRARPAGEGVEVGTGLAPPRQYTVRAGDSLWTIARDTLGDRHRWQDIYDANREVIGDDPNGIRRGMVLTIPAD